MSNQRDVSAFQLFSVVLCSSLFGTSLFSVRSLPDSSSRLAAVAIASVIVLIPVLLMRGICLRNVPEGKRLLGSAGTAARLPLLVLLFLSFFVRCCYTLHIYAEQVGLYLLSKTPQIIVIIALLLTSAAIAAGGIAKLSRISELLLLLLGIPLIIFFVIGLLACDVHEWQILLSPDIDSLWYILGESLLGISGVECALLLIDFKSCSKGFADTLLISYGVVCLLVCVSYLICCGALTVGGAESLSYPLIEAARSVRIGSISLSDRFDLLLMIIHIAALPAQTGVFLFCAATALDNILPSARQSSLKFLLIPAALLTWLCRIEEAAHLFRTLSLILLCTVLYIVIPAAYFINKRSASDKKGYGNTAS